MTSPEDSSPAIHASLTAFKTKTMIRLEFKYDTAIIEEVRSIRGRVWSVTHKCWYVPDTSENRWRFGVSDFEQAPNVFKEGMPVFGYQSICQSLLDYTP